MNRIGVHESLNAITKLNFIKLITIQCNLTKKSIHSRQFCILRKEWIGRTLMVPNNVN